MNQLLYITYIGDDISRYDLLSGVDAVACPHNACCRVKSTPIIHIMFLRGGNGCVREVLHDNYDVILL